MRGTEDNSGFNGVSSCCHRRRWASDGLVIITAQDAIVVYRISATGPGVSYDIQAATVQDISFALPGADEIVIEVRGWASCDDIGMYSVRVDLFEQQ